MAIVDNRYEPIGGSPFVGDLNFFDVAQESLVAGKVWDQLRQANPLLQLFDSSTTAEFKNGGESVSWQAFGQSKAFQGADSGTDPPDFSLAEKADRISLELVPDDQTLHRGFEITPTELERIRKQDMSRWFEGKLADIVANLGADLNDQLVPLISKQFGQKIGTSTIHPFVDGDRVATPLPDPQMQYDFGYMASTNNVFRHYGLDRADRPVAMTPAQAIRYRMHKTAGTRHDAAGPADFNAVRKSDSLNGIGFMGFDLFEQASMYQHVAGDITDAGGGPVVSAVTPPVYRAEFITLTLAAGDEVDFKDGDLIYFDGSTLQSYSVKGDLASAIAGELTVPIYQRIRQDTGLHAPPAPGLKVLVEGSHECGLTGNLKSSVAYATRPYGALGQSVSDGLGMPQGSTVTGVVTDPATGIAFSLTMVSQHRKNWLYVSVLWGAKVYQDLKAFRFLSQIENLTPGLF